MFAFMLVAVLVYQVIRDWNSIKGYPWRLNWLMFAGAFLLYTTNVALTAYVWKLIMQALSGVDLILDTSQALLSFDPGAAVADTGVVHRGSGRLPISRWAFPVRSRCRPHLSRRW